MATTADRKQTKSGRFYDIDGRMYPSVTTVLQIVAKPALLNWMAKTEREMVIEVSADLYETIHGTPKISRTGWVTTLQDRIGKEKAGNKEKAKAAEIGTQAHQLIEWNLHKMLGQTVGPEPGVQDKAMWSFMSWEDWAKSVDLKPLLIEQVVYSEKFNYAGTMDLYGEVSVAGLAAWFSKRGAVPEQIMELGKKMQRVRVVADWKTGKSVYSEAHLQNAAYRSALREMGHGESELGLIIRLPKVDTDPEFEVVLADDETKSLEVFLHFMAGWKWNQVNEEAYQNKKKAPQEAPQAIPVESIPQTTTQPTEAGKSAPVPQELPPNGKGSMAAVPAEIQPPYDLGCGQLETVEIKAHPKTKKPFAQLKQVGITLYARNNTDLPIGGGENVPLFDLLKLAVGKECVFSTKKTRVSGGYIYEVTGATRIGKHVWEVDGSPLVTSTAPPPAAYEATDEDVAF